MTKPIFQRRHYEAIARAINTHDLGGFAASRFATIFAADNPKFDRSRFLKACGVDL